MCAVFLKSSKEANLMMFNMKHAVQKTKRNLLLLFMVIGLWACQKETRENPFRPPFYIGTWDYAEIVHYSENGTGTPATEVRGFVRFRSGMKGELNWPGQFEVSFKRGTTGETETYEGKFDWRMDSGKLTVVMDSEDDEYPALGVGWSNAIDLLLNPNYVKENRVELRAVDPIFTNRGATILLQRR